MQLGFRSGDLTFRACAMIQIAKKCHADGMPRSAPQGNGLELEKEKLPTAYELIIKAVSAKRMTREA